MSEGDNVHESSFEPKKATTLSTAADSVFQDRPIEKETIRTTLKQTIAPSAVNEVKESEKSVEPMDWNVLKQSGLSELSVGGKSSKKVIPRSDLLAHVPSETTVVKYGYIESRVLDILEDIIETSGVLSRKTLDSISIEDMKLTEDGRDINVRFRINIASKRISNQGSPYRRMNDDFDDFDDDMLCIR